jgi:hypothetical protein
MNAATTSIYGTKAAIEDIAYRAWITEVNYIMLMNTGASIHGSAALDPKRMRSWYLRGLPAYNAAMRLNASGPNR